MLGCDNLKILAMLMLSTKTLKHSGTKKTLFSLGLIQTKEIVTGHTTMEFDDKTTGKWQRYVQGNTRR